MLLEPIALNGWRWAMVVVGAASVPLGGLHVALGVRGYRSIRAREAPRVPAAASTVAG